MTGLAPIVSHLRRVLLPAACFAAAGLIASAAVAADAPKPGGTLVIGSTQTPRHLNGAVQSGLATALPSTQLFAGPLRFDDQWRPQPYLAQSWKVSEDGKSLTLNLRRDAVFHDGKPITSEDVAFSIMTIKAKHPFQSMLAPVEKVETPDRYTAIIRMSQPHPAIVLAMSPALCPIMPKHVYGDGRDVSTHPANANGVVGSGPFKLVEFVPGQRIVMQKFDKFFIQGRPYLDKIVVTINPDAQSLALGMERGDIQMMAFASVSTDLKRMQANPNLVLTRKGYEGIGGLNWLAFNLEKKPLDDVRVRRAIASAIDKNFIVKALHNGFSTVSDGPIVRSSPFYTDDLHRYPFDLKRADALLDEAGLKRGANGERLTLTIDYLPGSDEQQKNVAEYVRAQLKKLGITVQVRASADFASWAKRVAAHDFDMTMDSVFNWGDPVIGVARTYMSSNIKPIIWTNTQSYRNPKVDEVLDTAASTLDATRRKAYYATFQKLVTDDLPIVYINEIPYYTVANKKLGNVPASIWGPASPLDEVYFK